MQERKQNTFSPNKKIDKSVNKSDKKVVISPDCKK